MGKTNLTGTAAELRASFINEKMYGTKANLILTTEDFEAYKAAADGGTKYLYTLLRHEFRDLINQFDRFTNNKGVGNSKEFTSIITNLIQMDTDLMNRTKNNEKKKAEAISADEDYVDPIESELETLKFYYDSYNTMMDELFNTLAVVMENAYFDDLANNKKAAEAAKIAEAANDKAADNEVVPQKAPENFPSLEPLTKKFNKVKDLEKDGKPIDNVSLDALKFEATVTASSFVRFLAKNRNLEAHAIYNDKFKPAIDKLFGAKDFKDIEENFKDIQTCYNSVKEAYTVPVKAQEVKKEISPEQIKAMEEAPKLKNNTFAEPLHLKKDEPTEEVKPANEVKPVDEVKPADEVKFADEVKSADKVPVEEVKPVKEVKPVEEKKPVEYVQPEYIVLLRKIYKQLETSNNDHASQRYQDLTCIMKQHLDQIDELNKKAIEADRNVLTTDEFTNMFGEYTELQQEYIDELDKNIMSETEMKQLAVMGKINMLSELFKESGNSTIDKNSNTIYADIFAHKHLTERALNYSARKINKTEAIDFLTDPDKMKEFVKKQMNTDYFKIMCKPEFSCEMKELGQNTAGEGIFVECAGMSDKDADMVFDKLKIYTKKKYELDKKAEHAKSNGTKKAGKDKNENPVKNNNEVPGINGV